MSHFAVNWLAVILATVVSWGFGAGWYMLFARQWTAAIGKKPEDIDKADYTPYLWSVLCLFIMAYFIALLTPALLGSLSVANGLVVGAHMWLGFVLTAMGRVNGGTARGDAQLAEQFCNLFFRI